MIKSAMLVVCDAVSKIEEPDDEEEKSDESLLHSYEMEIKKYVDMERQVSAFMNRLKNLESDCIAHKFPADMAAFLQPEDTKDVVEDHRTHTFYKIFCESAGIQFNEPEDDDADLMIQENQSTQNTRCPITQMDYVDPVKK